MFEFLKKLKKNIGERPVAINETTGSFYVFKEEYKNKIFLVSDLHLFHARGFVYKPRGFNDIQSMVDKIVENWNSTVNKNDDVFILGDLMLNNDDLGIEVLKSLNGRLHIIRGNHDTDNRIKKFIELDNIVEICDAKYIDYKGYHFYLSHYPTMTGNLENKYLKQMLLNIFGHTHSKDEFFEDRPYMYNVACDANNCTPVLLDDIITKMQNKVKECIEML